MLIFALISFFLFVPYAVLIAWYGKAWKAIPQYSPASSSSLPPSPHTRISVLIPARNEAANIGACLDSLSGQSYSKDLYEVIVIDDHSTDRTWEILQAWKIRQLADHPAMRFRSLQLADPGTDAGSEPGPNPVRAHKKAAIEKGIHAATGTLIVTTDADCRFPPDWLRAIARFSEETAAEFIAAPVKVDAGNSFLSIFQTLDFITLQGITGAAVHKKFHSMCNGANLAYSKKAFLEVDGFRGIDQIPSGDDMLLMHKIYLRHPGKVFYLKSPQVIVVTKEAGSWNEFFNQRIRWASKADRYDDKRIFWTLLLVYAVNLLFPVLLIASIWNIRNGWLFLFLLAAKTVIEYPFVRSAARFFDQQGLMAWFPLMQPLHIIYTVGVGWLGKFGSYRWKGRNSTG